MSIVAPCGFTPNPEAECTVERSIEAVLKAWDEWSYEKPPSFVCGDMKSPGYPYVKTSVLAVGDPTKSCQYYRFDTVARFRIYGVSEGCVTDVAADINACLKENRQGETKRERWCILSPGWPAVTALPDGVYVAALSLAVSIWL